MLELGSRVEVETSKGLVSGRLKRIDMEISFETGAVVAEFHVLSAGLPGYHLVGPEKLRQNVLEQVAEAANERA